MQRSDPKPASSLSWSGKAAGTPSRRLIAHVLGTHLQPRPRCETPLIGWVPGCGIGRELMQAAQAVLSAVAQAGGLEVEARTGGRVGEAALNAGEPSLPEGVVQFCEQVFRDGGAILSGPAGGRYVYDLRRRFDLFCKLAPVRTWPVLAGVTRVKSSSAGVVDLLIVRDNCAGVYQGTWSSDRTARGLTANHTFGYTEEDIERLTRVALSAAAARSGRVTAIVKEGGVPSITALWKEIVTQVARAAAVRIEFMNIDLTVYELVQRPEQFDVLLTPNLFGDVVVDLTAVLQGSRGVTFSGNFDAEGHGVYQTNHGCATDLAGRDQANPVGQILALAMLLRESFGLALEAHWIEQATEAAWIEGWRTADLAEPGCRVVGTQTMAARIAEHASRLASTERIVP